MTDVRTCAVCGGGLAFLGEMGHRVWGRCVACGMVQATEDCPECLGTGDIDVEEEGGGDRWFGTTETCPVCLGSGQRPQKGGAAA